MPFLISLSRSRSRKQSVYLVPLKSKSNVVGQVSGAVGATLTSSRKLFEYGAWNKSTVVDAEADRWLKVYCFQPPLVSSVMDVEKLPNVTVNGLPSDFSQNDTSYATPAVVVSTCCSVAEGGLPP